MDKIPGQPVLEYELLHLQLQKVLLYHNTDRWYLGDFIRHSSWLASLYALRPKSLELVTLSAYLPLYNDDRVNKLIDIAHFDETNIGDYDLVVIPSAYPPSSYNSSIKRALYTWDRGWAYVRYGAVFAYGYKEELNYFVAAQHKNGQTALSDAGIFPLKFPIHEMHRVDAALSDQFSNTEPIVLYNPTASNAFTRETNIKKEVDNSLTVHEHAQILKKLQRLLPGYNFLIGSAVKPGDKTNELAINELSEELRGNSVRSIFDLKLDNATSIRGFASIMAAPRVVGILGAGTGTNTHLASLVDLPSLSVERAADIAMVNNWKHPDEFQMGSFRWRNPAPSVAIYSLDWKNKSSAGLSSIADAFICHLSYSEEKYARLFTIPVRKAKEYANHVYEALHHKNVAKLSKTVDRLLNCMVPDAAAHYGNFSDELKYLGLQDERFECIHGMHDLCGVSADTLNEHSKLICGLFSYSNLYKLVEGLRKEAGPNNYNEAGSLFVRIRNGVPLNKQELNRLGAKNEADFSAGVNATIRAKTNTQERKITGKGNGWQHIVEIYDDVVVKTFAADRRSEYLTDEYSRIGVMTALENCGGFVPHSYLQDSKVISKKLHPIVSNDGRVPLYGNRLQEEVALPYGWIKEQLELHVELIKHGVFNFDLKLLDVGATDQGVLLIMDFSVFRYCRDVITHKNHNRRTDILRMSLGELMQNGQFISKFVNGEDLLERYCQDVHDIFNIHIHPYIDRWQWGDHEKRQYDQMIDRIADSVQALSGEAKVNATVYGLVDDVAMSIAYQRIEDRLADRDSPASSAAAAGYFIA